jgi:branched-chain amino acid transport system substrate-binding protein
MLAVFSVLALVGSACGGDDDDDAADDGTEETDDTATDDTEAGDTGGDRGNVDGQLVLGALLPQSGDLAVIYDALSVPVDMAIEEINAAGGVNGQDVVRASADDGTSADVATTALDTLLADDKIDAFVGPASSGTALGIIDKVRDAGVVECSGSNTSAELTDADDGGFYFRTAPPDKFQGPALAQLVLADGHTSPAIVTRNDSYGTGFGDALDTALTDSGANVVINAAYDPNATDFQADVAAVVDAGPDAVILIGFNDDGAKVLTEMIAQGVGPDAIQIYTADGMQSSSLGESVDAANPGVVSGIKGTAPSAAPGGVTHPFIDAYAATGNDTIFSSYYYDCTMLIALAAQAAGSDDPAEIAAAIPEVASGGEACQTYADCLALLEAGEDINYEGASGSVDFSDVGEPTSGVYDVWAYGADGSYANVEGAEQTSISDEDA